MTRTYYSLREGPPAFGEGGASSRESRQDSQVSDEIATALRKQDGIRVEAARLANRRWAKTRGVAIKTCFRLWNDPASLIEDGIEVAIRRPGHFSGGHQSRPRPWREIGGVRDADASPRHEGDAPKRAGPKSVAFRHFCLRHGNCLRHSYCHRRNRPCPAGLRVPSIV